MTRPHLALEADPANGRAVAEIFRAVHSIKGSARMLGLTPIAELSHRMEDVLDDVRHGERSITPELLDALFAGLECLRATVDAVVAGRPAPETVPALLDRLAAVRARPAELPVEMEVEVDAGHWLAPTAPSAAAPTPDEPVEVPAPARDVGRTSPAPHSHPAAAPVPPRPARAELAGTMRVAVDKVDKLLNLAGELTVRQLETTELVRQLNAEVAALDRLLQSAEARLGRDATERLHSSRLGLQQIQKQLRSVVGATRGVTDELHYEVTGLRMLPVSTLFDAFPVSVRDLAHTHGKAVHLVVEGSDTELDRTILSEMRDPLMHLVRNAIDHGIEPPDERARMGKARVGTLRLAAYEQGGQAIVEVSDDGAGIDLARLRDAAARRGDLSPAEAAGLSSDDTLDLVFRPGFSTSSRITETSGRGVGLDVVKTRVEGLKGQVRIQTAAGKGTTFFIELPLTLAFTRVLLVGAANHLFALPVAAVQQVLEVDMARIATVQARETIHFAGVTVPLVRLARVLNLVEPGRTDQPGAPTAKMPAVILGKGDRQVAFLVDEAIEEETLVVKSLGPVLRRVPNIAAGTILGNGRIALVLNVPELLSSTRSAEVGRPRAASPTPSRTERRQRRILVVDDALTTRELERSILLAAGYAVQTAVDGMDTVERLNEVPGGEPLYDLVVTDVEMPRMTGFELTETLCKDPRYAGVPVIIITSRASEEDRRRGLEAGAQAYLVKSAFEQASLLSTVERLVS